MLFFEVLKLPKIWLRLRPGTPSFHGPANRIPSGFRMDSIFTTSAPLSARYFVVIGPTPYQEKSKTLMPAATPVIALYPLRGRSNYPPTEQVLQRLVLHAELAKDVCRVFTQPGSRCRTRHRTRAEPCKRAWQCELAVQRWEMNRMKEVTVRKLLIRGDIL